MSSFFVSPGKKNSIVMAVLFCVLFTVLFIGLSFLKQFFPTNYERPAHALLGIADALLLTFIFLRLDKNTFIGIGLRPDKKTLLKFVYGIIAGLLLMGILSMVVIYSTGFSLRFNPQSNLLHLLWMTLPLLPLAFMEELAFRAYPFRIINTASGTRVAILVSSLLFALYHLANGWTVQNSFLGAGSWGLLFGVAAIYGNGIAMPTGLHYAVNLVPAAFGTTATGSNIWILQLRSGASLETYSESRLAELLPQLCILVTGLLLMEWVRKRKKESFK